MKLLATLFSFLLTVPLFSQNVDYPNNAGNSGNYNTSLGWETGHNLSKTSIKNTFVGHESGYSSTGHWNTFVGAESGVKSEYTINNSFFGSQSGYNNQSGGYNTFIGTQAGFENTTGGYNVYVGFKSGAKSGSATANAFLGSSAGEFATGGYNSFFGYGTGKYTAANNNTFIGHTSGTNNIDGSENVFVGQASGYNNVSGFGNVFLGQKAGFTNKHSSSSVFVGYKAGYETQEGNNTFIGYRSGESNLFGSLNTYVGFMTGVKSIGGGNTFIGHIAGTETTTGRNNTFLGMTAGQYNSKGDRNVFLGAGAGRDSYGGSYNTFVGDLTGRFNKDGDHNTYLGSSAGQNNDSGDRNLFLGRSAGFNNKGSSNVFIGYEAGKQLNGNELLMIANSSQSQLIYGNFKENHVAIGIIPSASFQEDFTLYVNGDAYATGYWKTSDKRFKEDITQLDGAMDMINGLQAYQYQYKQNKQINLPKGHQIGLIAQEVKEVLPQAVMEHQDGVMSVDYTAIVPVIIEALKELKAENMALKALVNQMVELPAGTSNQTATGFGTHHETILENIPNPGFGSTKIIYETNTSGNIELIIFDLNGKMVKTIESPQSKGTIEITSAQIGTGLFNYALVAEGKIIATSKMILK